MGRPGDHGWTTDAEVSFIKGLGTFNDRRVDGPQTRREWLDAYERTLDMRKDWDTNKMDREKVEIAIIDAMREERKRA